MGGSKDSGGDGGIPLMGVFNVLLKVTVSCLCAVMADKYMKDFKSLPFYVQLVQMKLSYCHHLDHFFYGRQDLAERLFLWLDPGCVWRVCFVHHQVLEHNGHPFALGLGLEEHR